MCPEGSFVLHSVAEDAPQKRYVAPLPVLMRTSNFQVSVNGLIRDLELKSVARTVQPEDQQLASSESEGENSVGAACASQLKGRGARTTA